MNTNAIKIKYGDNKWLEGDDFVEDGFVLTESICSESQIVFGACEAAAVEVSIISTAASFVGQTLEAYLGNDLLGKYKVVSDERASDGETRTLKAYDALYDIIGKDVAEWYSGINWDTVTNLKQFRDSFFSYLGIPQVQTTLPNDSMAVSKTMEMSSCSGATIINAICEINGGFGHINPNGYFQYVFLAGSETPVSISADEVFDTITEEFTVPSFDSVLIRTEEGDIGGQYPASGGENQYIITGNFLCYGKTSAQLQAIAQNASGRIFGKSYIPFEAEVECQNSVGLGGKVTIAADPVAITSYVLQRRLAGVSGLEEYFAAQGTAEYVEDVNGTRNQMVATAQRINKLTVTLDGTTSRVQTIENNYVTSTTLEQTEKGFTAKVEEIDNELQQITDQLDGKVTSYNISGTPVFRKNEDNTLAEANYPAITFTYNIYVHPTEAVQIGPEGVPFLYKDEYLQKHTRDLVTDTDTYHAYRFIKDSGIYDWKQIEDSDFGIAMSRISSLEATSESIKQTVTTQGVSITSQGARITTAEGTLVTQSNEIAAKVSVEGGTASTNASWSLKPDAFIVKSNGQEVLKVNGSGLSVNGSGTFSGEVSGGSININNNFIVDSSGNLTAKSGTFSGDITGAKITIGGVNKDIDAAVDGAYSAAESAESNAKDYVDGKGYQTEDDVEGIIDGKGYQTEKGVTTIIDGRITTDYVNALGITASDISATTISGKTLSGNTINNGNGSFSVDTNGNMTASKANITGGTLKVGSNFEVANDGTVTAKKINITGGSYSVGQSTGTNYFNVDANGTLKAKNAEIEGKITSSSADITGGSIKVVTHINGDAPNYMIVQNSYGNTSTGFNEYTRISPNRIETGGEYYETGSMWVAGISQDGIAFVSTNSSGGSDSTEITSNEIHTGYIEADGIEVDGKSVLTTESLKWTIPSPSVFINSGSQSATISAAAAKNKNTLILRGKLSSTYPYQMLTIPIIALTSTRTTYSISYGSQSLIIGIAKDSTGKITLTYEGASVSGAFINAAYLQ